VKPGLSTREDRVTLLFAAALVGVLSFALAPPWPDDWDGLGFLASIRRFDLDAFAPHPPGYPVYVALLRVGSLVFADPMNAAKAVAAISAATTVVLIALALRRLIASTRVRVLLSLAVVVTPLGCRCVTAVGSEAPALALTSLALYAIAADRPLCLGVAVGLALGCRLSWAPLVLPLLAFGTHRGVTIASTFASTVAWLFPLSAVVGPLHLLRSLWAHAVGHATRWGGTALTEPARIRFLWRDLFVDGLGADSDVLGIAIGVATALSAVLALAAWRTARWTGAREVGIVSAPYLVWVALGQNLREQPRHVLPLVALMALGLALAGFHDRRARWACLPLFVLVAVRAWLDTSARDANPPPGAALVAYVRSRPDANRVLVFGGASARFFQPTDLAARAFTVESMGDVAMTLTRVDSPPARVLVTSEVLDRDPSEWVVATFCRPARIDRRVPCIDVYEVDAGRIR
jgi:hypothetical protein